MNREEARPRHHIRRQANPLLRAIGATCLAIAIFVSWLILISSIWLSQTLFSAEHYQLLITRPGYLPLLRQAIEQDLQPQASFAGVPDAVLLAGLDNETIHLQLRQHVVNFATALKQSAAPGSQTPPLTYPADNFYQPLAHYLAEHNAQLGQPTTPDQIAALHEVADQAAQTVLTHIVLVDPALLLRLTPAQKALDLLRRLAQLALPAVSLLALLLLLTTLLTLRDTRQAREAKHYRPSGGTREVRSRQAQSKRARDPLLWLRAALNSTWLAAGLFLVPTIVLQNQNLASRLAIQTAYLKFAIETLLSRANQVLIVGSGTVFVLATLGLIALARATSRQKRAFK